MPFPQQTALAFNKATVESLEDGKKGCYGLFQQAQTGRVWIYVGKADNMRKRLLEHVNGDNPCITKYRPSHFVTVLASNNENLEKQLIGELDPYCNKKVG